jgi:hypothetical protein
MPSILIMLVIVIHFGNSASFEYARNSLEAGMRLFRKGAFPNSTYAPPSRAQNPPIAAIPPLVGRNFVPPCRRVSLWPQISTAAVAVPEAAVHEDGQSCVQENEVRFASQRIVAPPAMDFSFSQQSNEF